MQRSTSHFALSGKGGPIKAREQTVQIKIERPNKNQSQMTPFEIPYVYTPAKHSIIKVNRMVSFDKVQNESKPQICEQQSFYSYEDVMRLRPEFTSAYTPRVPISSPGFVVLCKNAQQGMSRSRSMKNVKSDRNPKNETQAKLIEHANERFIGISQAVSVGVVKKDSYQVVLSNVQRSLNILSHENLDNIVNQIYSSTIKEKDLILLLLDRATENSEFPEKNVQLALAICFAIKYSNKKSGFAESLKKETLLQGSQFLGNFGHVPLFTIETFSVWLSSLYNAKIVTFDELQGFLNSVMAIGTKERSIDIIRISLYICGKNIDIHSPLYTNAYQFLKTTVSSLGFRRFMVDELFLLIELKWDMKRFNERFKAPVLKIEKKSNEAIQVEANSKLVCSLINFYELWLNEEDIVPNGFTPETFVMISSQVLFSHFQDINDYVQFCGCSLRKLITDQSECSLLLDKNFPNIIDTIRAEENTMFWNLYFMLISAYFVEGLISFPIILKHLEEALRVDPKIKISKVIFKMSEITGFDIHSVLEINERIQPKEADKVDFIHSLIAISDLCEEYDEEVFPTENPIQCGLFMREFVSSAIENDPDDFYHEVDRKLPLLQRLYSQFGDLIIQTTNNVFDYTRVEVGKSNKLVEYLKSKII